MDIPAKVMLLIAVSLDINPSTLPTHYFYNFFHFNCSNKNSIILIMLIILFTNNIFTMEVVRNHQTSLS